MSQPRQLGEGLAKIQAVIDRKRIATPTTPTEETVVAPTASEAAPAPSNAPPTAETPKRQPARVPPGQRGQQELARTVVKLRGDVIEAKPISYYSPELIQCTLPHSDPGTPAWVRKNGNYALVVQSGLNSDLQPFGVPYGSFPRLVLAHIITRVIATNDRKIELSSHFSSFLKEVGYTSNHKGNGLKGKRLHDQLKRLLHAQVSFQYHEGDDEKGRLRVRQMVVAPEFDLWWDFKTPEQDSLFGSWIEISDDFFKAIKAAPVPLRTDILKELKKSPLAIDAYMWLSYRLFSMQANKQRELFVPLGALQNQFGTGIANENYRQFRQELKLALSKVAALWHHGSGAQPDKSLLKYEFTESGLFLYLSPLLIGRGERLTDQEQAGILLERRQFDRETLIKARQYSGKWDIDRLQNYYFQWLADTNTTPQNPAAHFIQFVKSHVKRNP
jgi:signal peptidase I